MVRLALVLRRKTFQFAVHGFQCWSAFASGKDLAGWKGPHENLSPTFCPRAVVQIILMVTFPHQARAYSHSICSLSWVYLTEEPGSSSQQPFPWVLTGSFVTHQSHFVSRLSWPCFLSLFSQDKCSSPHCLAALL